MSELLNISRDNIIGAHVHSLGRIANDLGLRSFVVGDGRQMEFRAERRVLDSKNQEYWFDVTYKQVQIPGVDQPVSLIVGADITAEKLLEATMKRQQFYDGLTGLPNRRRLIDLLGDLLEDKASRSSVTALGIIDVGTIHKINESYGSKEVDILLEAVADRLSQVIGPESIVARLEGEQFAVLLRAGQIGVEQLRNHAVAIVNAVNQPLDLLSHFITPMARLGIASVDSSELRADRILQHAYAALGRVNHASGPEFALFEQGEHGKAVEKLELSEAVRNVSKMSELEIYYQPILDLSTGKIVQLEALLRWNHPQYGLLNPLDFIPVAEESGAISEIGDWVLNAACRQLQSWQAQSTEFKDIGISINLSVVQLSSASFVDDTLRTLTTYGVNPKSITFEITESIMISQPDQTISRIGKLRDAGISVAIDDFGIGYSSMISVAQLRLNALKIDREFIRLIGSDKRYEVVTQSIINLGKALDLHITAEGVETLEQLILLQNLGCHCVQGYLLGRPQPVLVVEAMVESGIRLHELIASRS